MKSTWQANLIAAFVIGMTVFVGALGAHGSLTHLVGAAHPSGVIAPSDLERPAHPATLADAVTPADETLDVPSCGGRLSVRGTELSSACPADWFVWQNDAFTDGPMPQSTAIISNHRPLVEGSDSLPDGWFKADMYVLRSDPGATLARLEADMCADREAYGRIVSCGQVTIAARRWVSLVSHDQGCESHIVATIADGFRYVVAGFIPDGPSASQGRNEIADLLGSLRIASA
ncbi:MAG: hypothetical protein ACXVES_12840 [Actinomycetota bacterium]